MLAYGELSRLLRVLVRGGRGCFLAAGANWVAGAVIVIAHAVAAILAGTVAGALVAGQRGLFDYFNVEQLQVCVSFLLFRLTRTA